MTVTNPALPLYAADIERTCLPLEQATMLPGAAFTDPDVLRVGARQLLPRAAGSARVTSNRSARAGKYPDARRRRRERARHRRRRRPPARVPEHLPAPRRAAARSTPEGSARRLQCPYHAWTYGLDGSLKNAPFTEGLEDFDPKCFALHEVRLAVVEGLVLLDLSGEAPPPQEHIGDLAPLLAALPQRRARSAARGSSTTSTPTGRRSPRTTASACTARACTRSSTGSRTT